MLQSQIDGFEVERIEVPGSIRSDEFPQRNQGSGGSSGSTVSTVVSDIHTDGAGTSFGGSFNPSFNPSGMPKLDNNRFRGS